MPLDQIFIQNAWSPARSKATIPVFAPSTGEQIAEIARGGGADVDRAVTAARRAFQSSWGNLPAYQRGRLLHGFGELIQAHAEELVQLEAQDTGKPLKQARADIEACARYFEFYAGAADKLHGETIPFLDGYQVMILREPHGVVGHIIPWNYPAQMFGRTAAASLAAGNTCVLKPAEEACLSTLRLAELAVEAELPAGAINVVPGYGEEAGAALANHSGLDFLSFTGSPEVGVLVQQAAAANHIGCTLELGGKSPQIVFADADQEDAIDYIVRAIVQNAGQTCSAGSRVLVERDVFDGFIAELARRFQAVRVGPHDADLDCGPVISADQRDRVKRFLDAADAAGIPVLARGSLVETAPAEGYYITPTIYGPVPEDSDLAREEVFGPVLSVIPFNDEADALRLANDTDYGLIAGIWTRDGARQLRMAKAVRAGQVFVNGYGAGGGIELPFGGRRKSGHGREKGFEALYELTTTKTVVFRHG